MKDGDEFYKVIALVSKTDLDNLKAAKDWKARAMFEIIEKGGIKVYEVEVREAWASKVTEHITLEEASNAQISSRNGFKKYELE